VTLRRTERLLILTQQTDRRKLALFCRHLAQRQRQTICNASTLFSVSFSFDGVMNAVSLADRQKPGSEREGRASAPPTALEGLYKWWQPLQLVLILSRRSKLLLCRRNATQMSNAVRTVDEPVVADLKVLNNTRRSAEPRNSWRCGWRREVQVLFFDLWTGRKWYLLEGNRRRWQKTGMGRQLSSIDQSINQSRRLRWSVTMTFGSRWPRSGVLVYTVPILSGEPFSSVIAVDTPLRTLPR